MFRQFIRIKKKKTQDDSIKIIVQKRTQTREVQKNMNRNDVLYERPRAQSKDRASRTTVENSPVLQKSKREEKTRKSVDQIKSNQAKELYFTQKGGRERAEKPEKLA